MLLCSMPPTEERFDMVLSHRAKPCLAGPRGGFFTRNDNQLRNHHSQYTGTAATFVAVQLYVSSLTIGIDHWFGKVWSAPIGYYYEPGHGRFG